MEQVMFHPTHIVATSISLAALLDVTAESSTEMDPPPLHIAAPLPSATPEDKEAPLVDYLAMYYFNEDEARLVREMMRKYQAM